MRLASDAELLQRDLDTAIAWSDKWLLPFNEAKCNSLHFGQSNAKRVYLIQGILLDQLPVEHDLGVS